MPREEWILRFTRASRSAAAVAVVRRCDPSDLSLRETGRQGVVRLIPPAALPAVLRLPSSSNPLSLCLCAIRSSPQPLLHSPALVFDSIKRTRAFLLSVCVRERDGCLKVIADDEPERSPLWLGCCCCCSHAYLESHARTSDGLIGTRRSHVCIYRVTVREERGLW